MDSSALAQKKYSMHEQERLLAVLAEQLKLPLLQIARQAELGALSPSQDVPQTIQLLADSALELVDHYLLSLRLGTVEASALQPVSLSGVLHTTAHRLHKLADLYRCDIELDLSARCQPVMAHQAGLEAAMNCLGAVFIESLATAQPKQRGRLVLAAHRSRWGIVAGGYTNNPGLNTALLRRAQALYGKARQPLNQVVASAGAGVFVADALLTSMASHVRPARYHTLHGLAATLTPSHQLAII